MYRIDKIKDVFREVRAGKNKDPADGYFNYPKFYIIVYYAKFIRDYSNTDGFNISYSKAAHKYFVKAYYLRTNKRAGFEDQLVLHNTRRLNILTINDRLLYYQSRLESLASSRLRV